MSHDHKKTGEGVATLPVKIAPTDMDTTGASLGNLTPTGFDSLQAAQAGLACGQHPTGGTPVIVAPADAVQPADDGKYTWPPGFAGDLARFIYHTSYLPVREVSVAATLGLLAGVCGRAFTISGKSTSLYIILVARSAIGKDAIHDGIPELIQMAQVPMADRFINATNFASGPALQKAIIRQPGFLNLQGEFGRKLAQLANPRNAPMQELRRTMTDAYAKKHLSGVSYSDSEKTLDGVMWPALSFIGETTPRAFYDALTPDMMEDGFMSRFLVIHHDGERPMPNEAREFEMQPHELQRWRDIINRAIPYQSVLMPAAPIEVGFATADAFDKLKDFELKCGREINSTDDESRRQMWNRAHLKALQISALLAIADNEVFPKITLEHATWAKTIVRHGIDAFSAKMNSGDIGDDDHTREAKLKALMLKYLREKPRESYRIHPDMQRTGAIPRRYLQTNVSSASAFNNHKLGAARALDDTIRSLVDSGYIVEIAKDKVPVEWGPQGKCFRILELPT